MKNTLRPNVAPLLKWLALSGVLLLATNQRIAHAQSLVSDDQLKSQKGAVAYSDGSCSRSNDCTSSFCAPTTTAGVACASVVNNHWFACDGNQLIPPAPGIKPAGTTCVYPRARIACSNTWTGTPSAFSGVCGRQGSFGVPTINRCTKKGPAAEFHNSC